MSNFRKEKTKLLTFLILSDFDSVSIQNLNNIFYYLDVCHLIENGMYITRTTYFKTKDGFVSKDILSLIEEMKEESSLFEENGFLKSFLKNPSKNRDYLIHSFEFSISNTRTYIEFIKNGFESCDLSDSFQNVVFNSIWKQKKLNEEMTIYDSAQSTGDTALIEFLKSSYY